MVQAVINKKDTEQLEYISFQICLCRMFDLIVSLHRYSVKVTEAQLNIKQFLNLIADEVRPEANRAIEEDLTREGQIRGFGQVTQKTFSVRLSPSCEYTPKADSDDESEEKAYSIMISDKSKR